MDTAQSKEAVEPSQARYKLTFRIHSARKDLRSAIDKLLRFGSHGQWQLKAKGDADTTIPEDLIFDSYHVHEVGDDLFQLEITAYSFDEWVVRRHTEFQPMVIDNDLVIKAPWDRRRFAGKTVINILPGIAFGSGTHPSTRLCLLALKKFLRPGRHVLDVGCGTGILSIAAAKLGAASVTAVDIDPAALVMARHNAVRNRVAGKIAILAEGMDSDLPRGKYDLIAANLVLDLHTELAEKMAQVAGREGILICGGVQQNETDEVKRIFRQHSFRMRGVFSLGDWRTIVFRYA
jgi:ribosomal protein L11 methyltransferase